MTRGPSQAHGKINLAYLNSAVPMLVDGYDTVSTQLTNASAGDMFAATLEHQVSNDGINWVGGKFSGTSLATAAGTQTYLSNIIAVQGWAWYRFVTTAIATGNISAVSIANPTVITTSAPHGLTSGATIKIAGTNTTASTVGSFVVTVTDATHFTIPVNVSGVTTGTGTYTGFDLWVYINITAKSNTI